jgi:hypothetical protein
MRGSVLVVGCAFVSLAACFAGGVLGSSASGLRTLIGTPSTSAGSAETANALSIVVLYTFLFTMFLVGFAAFLRTRKRSAAVPVARAWTIAVTIIAMVVPWILYTILGSLDRSVRDTAIFASPSPAYAYFAFERELRKTGDGAESTMAALAAALLWGAIGMVLLGVAWERSRRAVAAQERIVVTTQKKLDLEAEEDDDDDAASPPDAPPPLPSRSA